MATALPPFRAGLRIVPRRLNGKRRSYLVHDEERRAVYELGEEEYFLCSRLDGTATAPDVQQRWEEHFGRPLTSEELDGFLRHLGGEGLLEGWTQSPATFAELIDRETFLPVGSLTVAGPRADRLFGQLARTLRFTYTRPALALQGAVIALAVLLLLADLPRLVQALGSADGPWLLAGVLLASCVIQSLRSVTHAVSAKRYGAQVTGARITFLYYVLPCLFADYAAIRFLPDPARRRRTLLAGIWFQALVGAVATIGWWVSTPDGLPGRAWLVVALSAIVGLVLFTANPLVEMAGYYLLVQKVGMPRLRERALAVFGSRVTGRTLPEPLTRRERRWLTLYGATAFFYVTAHLLFILVVLWLWLTPALGGVGAILTLLIGAFMIHRPLVRTLADTGPARSLSGLGGSGRRLVWLGVAVLLVVLLLLPYPYETGGPFNVLPNLRTEVRCEIDGGRVVQVFVREGQAVTVGQPLARIDSREIDRNAALTEAELDATAAKLDLARKELALLTNPPNIETIRLLEAEQRRLGTLLADYRKQGELTTLRAPIAGRVTTPLVEQSVGKYLKQGDLFAAIEQAEAVQVEIHVPEADWPQVKPGADVKVVAWAYPYDTFRGTVTEIAPVALPPPGATGGTKSVRVVAKIDNPDQRLKSQLTGFGKIRTDMMPVWRVASRLITRWFAVQFWYWLP